MLIGTALGALAWQYIMPAAALLAGWDAAAVIYLVMVWVAVQV